MGGIISSDYIDKYDKKRRKSGRGTLLVVGLDGAGKTMVTYRLVLGRASTTVPTTGHNKETVAREGKKWDVFDVGGSLLVRETWRLYARAADGIVFVVDSTDEKRFAEAKMWMRNFYLGEKGTSIVNCPLLVLANKQDQTGTAIPYKKVEKTMALEELPIRHKMMLPCSATTGENIEVAFQWLMDTITSTM